MITKTKTTWRKVKLGEIADFAKGKKPQRLTNKKLSENFKEYILLGDEKFYTEPDRFLVDAMPSDILIVADGARSGAVLAGKGGVLGSTLLRIRIKNEAQNKVDSRFLYFGLKHFERVFQSVLTGSAIPHIDQKNLRDFELLIPEDPVDQKHIANILSAFDEKIELNNKINENLEQMAQAIFKEWFIDSKKLKVKSEKLEEVAKVIKGKKPQKIYDKPRGGDLEYLLIESLTTNNRFFTDDDKTPKSEEGDAIVVMDGASSGRIFRGRKGVVGSTLAVVKPRQGISREFLLLLLKRAEPQLMDNLTGSAIPHLDKDFLKTYPVSVPTPEIMERFTAFISPMLQKIVGVENENQKLSSLRDLLLPKLMSGEIRV